VNISIVSGWLPIVLRLLAVAVLVASVDWPSGKWRRQLAYGLPIAAAVTAAVALVAAVGLLTSSNLSWSTYVWGFTFILAFSVAVTGWAGDVRWRKWMAVVAVILTLLTTLDTIDQQSYSFPTLGRLVTLDPEDVVENNPQLQQIRSQVAATGTLPDHGVVIEATIPPKVSHFSTRPAYVYLPPAWFARVTPSLPTLVLLPGEPGNASDWSSDGDADDTADAFAQSHHGVAPIIVMPDPNGTKTVDSECVNSQFGNAETYLAQDVPAFVRSRFGASTKPGSLAIGGLSAGGTCSILLALLYPTIYPTFASFSGFASPQYMNTTRAETIDTLFGGSAANFAAHDPQKLLDGHQYPGTAGWFEVGDEDSQPLQAAHLLQPAALRAGIATCILVRPGGHDFALWSQALQDSFPWLAWRLGLTPQPDHEPAKCESP
jgi:S-formylglutathione hydrolase FrmB